MSIAKLSIIKTTVNQANCNNVQENRMGGGEWAVYLLFLLGNIIGYFLHFHSNARLSIQEKRDVGEDGHGKRKPQRFVSSD